MNTKRIISLLLTFAMVVGMLATGAVSAFAAEDTVITRIEVTINGMEVGRPLSGVTVTAPADANYEVSIISFGGSNETITDLSRVIGNQYYKVGISVTPKEGYTLLEDDAQIVINATGLISSSAYVRESDDYLISNIFDFGTPIDKVDITVTGMEEGKSAADVKVTVPQGANYVVERFLFIDSKWDEFSGTFGKGKYTADIYLKPADGHRFTEDIVVTINGGEPGYLYAESDYLNAVYDVDLRTPIDKVAITVTGVEEGKSIADVKVTVPEGAGYTLRYVDIRDSERQEFAGVLGKEEYGVRIALDPVEGYYFHGETQATINGGEPDYLGWATSTITLEYYVDFRTPIDKVELTVTGMEQGKSAADVKVTVPEGANYALDRFYIMDSYWDEFSGTFGKGGYTADIYLKPAEGYCFSKLTQVSINGSRPGYLNADESELNVEYDAEFRTPIDKVDITVTGMEEGKSAADVKVTVPEGANYALNGFCIMDSYWDEFSGTFGKNGYTVDLGLIAPEGYYFAKDVQVTINGERIKYPDAYGDELIVEYEVEFRTLLDRLELPAWPTVAVGGKIPEPALVLPEGTHYAYMIQVAEYLPGEMTQEIGTYQNDKVYIIVMMAQAEPGYAFAKNTTVTVGGETFTGMVQVDGDACGIVKMVSLGSTKLVDKISVSTEQPTAGKAPGKITNAGTGYTLKDTVWGVSNTDSLSGVREPGSTFQVGEYVYMSLYIKLDSGYVFDPNAEVWVNGKAYDLIVEGSWTEGDEGMFLICLGQLKATATPPTGDSAPIAMLVVLTVASMLGMGLLIVRRKTF